MSEEVNNIINNLCDKLGYAASEITPEMAKYMIVKDGVMLLLSIAGIALGILVIVWIVKHYKKAIEDNPYHDPAIEIVVVFAAVVVTIIALIVACTVGTELVGWIVSPKASMVEYVLHVIGQKG